MSEVVNIGFLPLTDAAALIACADLDFGRAQGLDIRLHRDVSWANLRDKLMVGHYDAAHMLAPLALAATLGIGQAKCPLRAPFLLNLNGNGITVSPALFAEMSAFDGDPLADWRSAARAVAAVVAKRRGLGGPGLTFATVHLFSTHTYLLRRFLQAGGLDPDHDVEFVVTPPSFMVEFMTRGLIDAFCVGSPWNSLAVDRGQGILVALGCEIDAAAPEKVLALPENVRFLHEQTGAALLRALANASAWISDRAHHGELASIMARADRLDCSHGLVERTLSGRLLLSKGGPLRESNDFIRFGGPGLHRPDTCVGWLVREMQAAGQIVDADAGRRAAEYVFSADQFLAAGL